MLLCKRPKVDFFITIYLRFTQLRDNPLELYNYDITFSPQLVTHDSIFGSGCDLCVTQELILIETFFGTSRFRIVIKAKKNFHSVNFPMLMYV